uniref:Uncharacterized protein n=1 Tax=Oryza glaberrima TaxID=4538 RepID=A0A679BAZ0_ORYGL|nr:hypothetical protein [Oryza glaberrima]
MCMAKDDKVMNGQFICRGTSRGKRAVEQVAPSHLLVGGFIIGREPPSKLSWRVPYITN